VNLVGFDLESTTFVAQGKNLVRLVTMFVEGTQFTDNSCKENTDCTAIS
jgi:hypothetical protein